MRNKLGWKEETTWGQSPLNAPTTDTVTWFGKMNYETPHPYHQQVFNSIGQLGDLQVVDIIPGMKNLEFNIKHDVVHAYDWKYILGVVSGGNTMTIGNTNWKSRTIYSEMGDDILEITGCYVKQADFYLQRKELVTLDLKFWGKEATVGTKITTATNPVYPTGLVDSNTRGYNMLSELQYNDVNQAPEIDYAHVTVINNLVKRTSKNSTKVLDIKRKGCYIVTDFRCNVTGNANSMWKKALAGAISAGATNDLELAYLWDGSYYHKLQIHNLQLYNPVVVRPPPGSNKPFMYHLVGQSFKDGTNEQIEVTTNDGVAYA